MARVLVLGAGYQGAVIAKTLAAMPEVDKVTVADIDDAKLRRFEGTPNIVPLKADVSDEERLSKTMKGFDLVSGALPSSLGYRAVSAAIKAHINMVDTSFMLENPLNLDTPAKASSITVVPDCGVAPGLSNILVGHALKRLDRVDEVHIAVGGLPQEPLPPLLYAATWSVRDLIEEYTRPARMIRDGRQVTVDALSEVRHLDVPGVGRLEAFYTDGLRTLLDTVRGVGVMDEQTLRYPGHVEKVRVLRDCGFFSEEPVKVSGCSVAPADVSAAVLSRILVKKDVRDTTVFRVQVSGEKNGERMAILWQMLDRYDEVRGISSMARTTGYTNVVVCTLLLRGLLKEKGVIPPEMLGMNEAAFTAVMSELSDRGVKVDEYVSRIPRP